MCVINDRLSQVQHVFVLDVVVHQRAAILEHLALKHEVLLVHGGALLTSNEDLDVVDRVEAFDVQGDDLTFEGLHIDLHPAGGVDL